ncbi:MAG: hypothetical protein M0Q53_11605 [Prolixibacteraceae bacterium]|jgi:hypothetical protein|nr:hypothetical protein [Prolixibacteraceae bacterium]
MKNLRYLIAIPVVVLSLIFFTSCTTGNKEKKVSQNDKTGNFNIGWASEDITPESPVLLQGLFNARISEGVKDPITVTALAIESGRGPSSEKAIMISCDLIGIDDFLRDSVRSLVKKSLPELRPEQVIVSATHTHTAPVYSSTADSKSMYGVELDAMAPTACLKYISERIAKAAVQAWNCRKPGGISFGLGHAVIGDNRLAVDFSGKSTLLGKTDSPDFSHLEGYMDNSVNLLYTWDKTSKLTGIMVNIACPAQVSVNEYFISADFWHDTRLEVRQRLSKDIFILPQCSAAGDLGPYVMVGAKAEERMQRIMGPDSIATGRFSMGRRNQIAIYIADAITSVLQYMKKNIEWNPEFVHRTEIVELSRRLIGIGDVNNALKESEGWKARYDELLLKIKENPEIMKKPRWYFDITDSYTRMRWRQSVKERYELEKRQPKMPVEVHVLRIGDIAIATNPFELYLDYGMRIKGRSPATQTFLVQLTGCGYYLPPSRSIEGGSYGAVPASTVLGPEGGQELVEKTLGIINPIWNIK